MAGELIVQVYWQAELEACQELISKGKITLEDIERMVRKGIVRGHVFVGV